MPERDVFPSLRCYCCPDLFLCQRTTTINDTLFGLSEGIMREIDHKRFDLLYARCINNSDEYEGGLRLCPPN